MINRKRLGQKARLPINYISYGGGLKLPERVPIHMDKEQLYLWCANPEDVLTEAVSEACAQMMSEEECARWQTFRFERHRREYLATRALVRIALSRYHPVAPEAWRFELNSYGKPAVYPDCGLRFNLSNSAELVVCLIARGAEVGVDAEPYERAGKIADLGPEVFSPLELAQLEALRGRERWDRALSLWTLKEAYIKARGMGLTVPLNKLSFLFGGADGIRLQLDPYLCAEPGRNWWCSLVDHAGHRIALMTDGAASPELQLWEAGPMFAAPVRLPAAQERWFRASGPQGLRASDAT
jgi:4'-phosphopantetheinyl transferase